MKAEVTPYPDGPYLVRGATELVDADGETIELWRPVVAICRCGRSRRHPFCDGTHKLVGFRAPGARRDGAEAAPQSPGAVSGPGDDPA